MADNDDALQLRSRSGVDWRAIIFSVALGASSGASVPLLMPGLVRPLPFTSEDAAALKREMRLEVRESLYALCTQMPPTRTRSRIAKLEGWISQRDPLFTPGDLQWGDSNCGKSISP